MDQLFENLIGSYCGITKAGLTCRKSEHVELTPCPRTPVWRSIFRYAKQQIDILWQSTILHHNFKTDKPHIKTIGHSISRKEVSIGNVLFSLQVNLFPRLFGRAVYRYLVACDKIARGKVS
jgi:hypothetical protein